MHCDSGASGRNQGCTANYSIRGQRVRYWPIRSCMTSSVAQPPKNFSSIFSRFLLLGSDMRLSMYIHVKNVHMSRTHVYYSIRLQRNIRRWYIGHRQSLRSTPSKRSINQYPRHGNGRWFSFAHFYYIHGYLLNREGSFISNIEKYLSATRQLLILFGAILMVLFPFSPMLSGPHLYFDGSK